MAAEETVASKENAQSELQGEVSYWPVLDFDAPPYRLHHFHHQFKAPSHPNNFLKAAKWSPDGSCFVTSSDDDTLRFFDMAGHNNIDFQQNDSICSETDSFSSRLSINEGESIYDFCWYPKMHSLDLTSCVLATTTRDHPIHLWDSFSGELRCTYKAYDAMDEISTAYSVAFNPLGSKLFCGYNKVIRAFDVHRPGRECTEYSTVTSTKDGQSGIISCLAFSPTFNGLVAAGSYNQTTALYSEGSMELLFVLHGQEGGVTQVLFSKDGNYLYTGGRKDSYILCWDVRNTSGILYKFYRCAENTNQRIGFDIDPCGHYLGTGGQDGCVNIYNLSTGQWVTNFQAAYDTVNGFCFHPYSPLAVSSSGHRRFLIPDDDEEALKISVQENCASVWSFSCTWVNGYVAPEDDAGKPSTDGQDSEHIGITSENTGPLKAEDTMLEAQGT